MTRIALYHSVLGIRQGVMDAANAFRDAGHDVLVVDQYDGRTFDDYDEASRFADSLGFPAALMESALAAVADEPGPLVTAGFSNGAGMAEYVAAARGGKVGGILGSLQFSGALPLQLLGLPSWPPDTPAQLHYAAGDPRRSDDWITAFVDDVRASGSACESFLDYSGGHLFTDPSQPDECDKAATALAFERALEFLERLDRGSE
jgi:dienelactone hydrolase